MNLLFINWNPDPILFSIGGFSLRWYSVFWFIAIWAASQVVYKLYPVSYTHLTLPTRAYV